MVHSQAKYKVIRINDQWYCRGNDLLWNRLPELQSSYLTSACHVFKWIALAAKIPQVHTLPECSRDSGDSSAKFMCRATENEFHRTVQIASCISGPG